MALQPFIGRPICLETKREFLAVLREFYPAPPAPPEIKNVEITRR